MIISLRPEICDNKSKFCFKILFSEDIESKRIKSLTTSFATVLGRLMVVSFVSCPKEAVEIPSSIIIDISNFRMV
jgi:hypothetical protein